MTSTTRSSVKTSKTKKKKPTSRKSTTLTNTDSNTDPIASCSEPTLTAPSGRRQPHSQEYPQSDKHPPLALDQENSISQPLSESEAIAIDNQISEHSFSGDQESAISDNNPIASSHLLGEDNAYSPDNPIASLSEGLDISCDQSSLSSHLNFIRSAISNKPPHPILANGLIEADFKQQRLHLTTFNLEYSMTTSIDVTVKQAGRITLPIDLLSKVINKFPRQSIFDIHYIWEQESPYALISSSGSKYQIPTMPASEFPSLPKLDKYHCITINASTLIAQLKGVLLATTKDETKRILMACHLQIAYDESRQATQVRFWATNGYLIATNVSYISGNGDNSTDAQLNLTAAIAREVIKNCHDTEAIALNYQPQLSENNDNQVIRIDWNCQSIISRTIAGQYPNCNAIIEPLREQFNRQVVVEATVLANVLSRLATLSDKQIYHIELEITDKSLQLSINNSTGVGTETIPAQLTGEPISLKLNLHYLHDIADAIAIFAPSLCMAIASEQLPIAIKPLSMSNQTPSAISAEYLLAPIQ